MLLGRGLLFYSALQLDSYLLRIKRRKWEEFSTPVGDASLLPSLPHLGFHSCIKYKNHRQMLLHFKNWDPHQCEPERSIFSYVQALSYKTRPLF